MATTGTIAAKGGGLGLTACIALVVGNMVGSGIFLIIRARTGRSVAGPETLKVALLGGLGFLYAAWAIYGAGAETVFLGFLLILAGIPVHVAIKWRNRDVLPEEI